MSISHLRKKLSFQDLIEATITFHEICAYGETVYKAVMHSRQAITFKKLIQTGKGVISIIGKNL